MKKMEDGKATLRDIMAITQEVNDKVDDIKNTLNDKYVTKEEIAPMKKDIAFLIAFRYWLAGAVTVMVFLIEFFKEKIFGH